MSPEEPKSTKFNMFQDLAKYLPLGMRLMSTKNNLKPLGVWHIYVTQGTQINYVSHIQDSVYLKPLGATYVAWGT